MKAQTFVESLAVLIVCKSSSKIHLCWKHGKQDVARGFRNFDKNIAAICAILHNVIFIDSLSKNDASDFGTRNGYT